MTTLPQTSTTIRLPRSTNGAAVPTAALPAVPGGIHPGAHAASGAFQMTAYTATQLIADGIKGAGSDDPTKVAKYLHSNTFDTPIGKVSWNKQGDLTNFQFDVFTWHKDGSKTVYK